LFFFFPHKSIAPGESEKKKKSQHKHCSKDDRLCLLLICVTLDCCWVGNIHRKEKEEEEKVEDIQCLRAIWNKVQQKDIWVGGGVIALLGFCDGVILSVLFVTLDYLLLLWYLITYHYCGICFVHDLFLVYCLFSASG